MTEKDLELFKMDQGKNEWVRRSRIKYESALNENPASLHTAGTALSGRASKEPIDSARLFHEGTW